MVSNALISHADSYLSKLCLEIPGRVVGSPGNHAASAIIREQLEQYGALTATQRFDCLDYRSGDIRLTCGQESFNALISPYSNPCDIQAPLVQATVLDDLRSGDFRGKLLLLSGEITREQLMPRKYVFYNPDTHKEINRLLEQQQPAAIITATGQNSELAGAPYPFPMIEDGDFDIPVAYLTDVEGQRLEKKIGQPAHLFMDAQRLPSWAENVSASFGPSEQRRFVVCAHLDAKEGSPGAVDNAGGIVTLLLLAELLRDTPRCPSIEILAINGEDHYSAGGELAYLKLLEGKLDQIRLVINIDGAGFRGYTNALSFYGTEAAVEQTARKVMEEFPTLGMGESWPQSDHMVFAMNQVPAIAITTQGFAEMEKQVAHTARDIPDIVDTQQLVEAAQFIKELIFTLEKSHVC